MQEEFLSYIDELFLQKLEKLHIIAKKGIHDMGKHVTARRGEGLEFLDYRLYQSGDDLRYIDWNVYGRTGKLFVKIFHAETSRMVHIILDMSRSMEFGVPSKMFFAKRLAAMLSFLYLCSYDRISLEPFSNHLMQPLGPVTGKKQFFLILQFLQQLHPQAATRINFCLQNCAERIKPHEQVIIISDFLDPAGYETGLKCLAYSHADVDIIHIFDPHEAHFDHHSGMVQLEDIESAQNKLLTIDRKTLEYYKKSIQHYITRLEDFCIHHGLHFFHYQTDTPVEHVVSDYIVRKNMSR